MTVGEIAAHVKAEYNVEVDSVTGLNRELFSEEGAGKEPVKLLEEKTGTEFPKWKSTLSLSITGDVIDDEDCSKAMMPTFIYHIAGK